MACTDMDVRLTLISLLHAWRSFQQRTQHFPTDTGNVVQHEVAVVHPILVCLVLPNLGIQPLVSQRKCMLSKVGVNLPLPKVSCRREFFLLEELSVKGVSSCCQGSSSLSKQRTSIRQSSRKFCRSQSSGEPTLPCVLVAQLQKVS